MGNILSYNTDSINWKDVNTNDMSSENIFKNNNRPKVEKLINNLQYNIQENQLSDSINEIFNIKYDKYTQ